MDNETAAAPAAVPVFSQRALQALASTRSWALFVAGLLAAEVVFNLVRAVAMLAHGHAAALTPFQAGKEFGTVSAAVVLGGVNIALGWYALRFARNLGNLRRNTSAVDEALRAQHGYWRLLGALTIAALALIALSLALIVAALALHHR